MIPIYVHEEVSSIRCVVITDGAGFGVEAAAERHHAHRSRRSSTIDLSKRLEGFNACTLRIILLLTQQLVTLDSMSIRTLEYEGKAVGYLAVEMVLSFKNFSSVQ